MYSVSWPAFWPYAAKNEKFGCNQRVYPNNLKYSRKIHTVSCWLIQITDISFPRNREGSCKPLKTLWKSTMGVQSPSTLPSVPTGPLNTLETSFGSCKGNRITPSNLSESISSLINYFCWLDPNAQPKLQTLDCAIL